MDVFLFINTVSVRSFAHFIKLKRAVNETNAMKRNTPMHTLSTKADLSDSMEMIVQLAKKSLIQNCHILKQKERVSDS